MYEDAHGGFLILDESDINDPDSNTEVESLTSTPEVEISNDDKLVTSIIKDEEADMFPEGARFMQDINEAIEIFPENKDDEVLISAENVPKRDNAAVGIY